MSTRPAKSPCAAGEAGGGVLWAAPAAVMRQRTRTPPAAARSNTGRETAPARGGEGFTAHLRYALVVDYRLQDTLPGGERAGWRSPTASRVPWQALGGAPHA